MNPVTSQHGAITVTLQLAADADILLDVLGREVCYPSLALVHGGISVIIEPYGPSEGGPITENDVRCAQEFADQAAAFHRRLQDEFDRR